MLTSEPTQDSVAALFFARARLQSVLEFEAELARALAASGVIDTAAADAIVAQCDASRFDLARVLREAAGAGNEAIPIVEQLRALVEPISAEAASYVHWGATSQDAIDTGFVLQLRRALSFVDDEVACVIAALASLAADHAATPMAGRTWLQHAAPTTFGFKAATWLDAMLRHRARLADLRDACVLQFGGAVGGLAGFGMLGPRVAEALAAELRLELPAIPWHATRDRIADVATTLAMLAGTLGKIARDVSLMAQSEVGEVREPGAPGRGRSSTMPHKQNPVGCATVLATSLRVPGLASTVLSAMVQEHERALGGWQAEWETVPQICTLTYAALSQMTAILLGLQVNARQMAANLDATRGLVFAEAVSFALVPRVGRQHAAAILERAMSRTRNEGTHLRDALLQDPDVRALLSTAEIERLFDPRQHIGGAAAMAKAVVDRAQAGVAPRTRGG